MHKWIDAEQGKLWTTKEIRLKGSNEGNIKHGRQFFFFYWSSSWLTDLPVFNY